MFGCERLGFVLGDVDRQSCNGRVGGKLPFDDAVETLAKGNGQIALDQFVFSADERLRAARIALARGAPEELSIDAPDSCRSVAMT